MSPRLRELRSIWRVGPESSWTTVLPVAFIIISLLSLVLMPIVVSRHTAKMRDEITRVAEPARQSANQIQVGLSGELDRIIAWQVTGDDQYRQRYFSLVRQEEASRRALAALMPKLDSSLNENLSLLFAQTARWHEGVGRNELMTRQMPQEIVLTRLFEQHAAYEKSLAEASELEVALQSSIEDRLRAIRQAESWNYSLTIVLTLLALISAMLVAGLGRQMRLLAGEATERRKEAEREAAEAQRARAAAEREERRAAFIASAGQELAASLDYEQTIATAARLVVPNLAAGVVIDLVDEQGGFRRAAAVHRDERLSAQMWAGGEQIETVLEVLRGLMDAREVHLIGGDSPISPYAGANGAAASLVVVPLVSRGQALGVMIAFAPPGRKFAADDVPLFAELARRTSLAIDNARLYLDSQQAARAREEVLAIVSHDLRNPLGAVTLAASLLKMSEMPAEEREQVETIGLSARRMSRLIEDLLDVTRLEGGKRLPVDRGPLELGTVFDEAYELFKAQAAAAAVSLQRSGAESVPPVFADRHRVMQVLSNLIGNALKFTPAEGVVALSAKLADGEALITVSDTGPGIPPQDLADVFNPYWQAKRTERLGAGLGLPIARGIVESHGGRIWAESEPGEGSRFHFTLPLVKEQQKSVGATPAAESPARR